MINTVRCSETLHGMTLYRALYGGLGLWVRPAAMFNESGVFEAEPTTCCERGCNGCVWEGFYAAMNHCRTDALAPLRR